MQILVFSGFAAIIQDNQKAGISGVRGRRLLTAAGSIMRLSRGQAAVFPSGTLPDRTSRTGRCGRIRSDRRPERDRFPSRRRGASGRTCGSSRRISDSRPTGTARPEAQSCRGNPCKASRRRHFSSCSRFLPRSWRRCRAYSSRMRRSSTLFPADGS